MQENRFRDKQLSVRVTGAEKQAIKKRMADAGYSDMSRFMRIMAIHGYLVTVDLSDFKKYAEQISKIGNNINQIARKVNIEQEIYSVDIMELQDAMKRVEKTVQRCMDVFLNMGVDEFGNIENSEN